MFTRNLLEVVNSVVNQSHADESEILLKEYTEATVQKLLDKFSGESPKTPKDVIRGFIEIFDKKKNAPYIKSHQFGQDIFKWDFKTLSHEMSKHNSTAHLYPDENKVPEIVYAKNGLTIKKAHTEGRCVEYGDGYSWCISRKVGSLFNSYRSKPTEPVFYFVYDEKRPKEDNLHHVVIHVTKDQEFVLTDADNRFDRDVTWEELVQTMPKLKGLKDIFQPFPISPAERKFKSMKISDEEFLNLSFDDKREFLTAYIGFKLSDKTLKILRNTKSWHPVFNDYVRTRVDISKEIFDLCSPSQKSSIKKNLIDLSLEYPDHLKTLATLFGDDVSSIELNKIVSNQKTSTELSSTFEMLLQYFNKIDIKVLEAALANPVTTPFKRSEFVKLFYKKFKNNLKLSDFKLILSQSHTLINDIMKDVNDKKMLQAILKHYIKTFGKTELIQGSVIVNMLKMIKEKKISNEILLTLAEINPEYVFARDKDMVIKVTVAPLVDESLKSKLLRIFLKLGRGSKEQLKNLPLKTYSPKEIETMLLSNPSLTAEVLKIVPEKVQKKTLIAVVKKEPITIENILNVMGEKTPQELLKIVLNTPVFYTTYPIMKRVFKDKLAPEIVEKGEKNLFDLTSFLTGITEN